MASEVARPTVRLRLHGEGLRDGEIPLDDLARVATQTQRLLRRIARSLIGQDRPGRSTARVEKATSLNLVGLHNGSTVLELAGIDPLVDGLDLGDLPVDLGDISLRMLVDGFAAIAEGDAPEMPVGYGQSLLEGIDDWFGSLRRYSSVGLEANVRGHFRSAAVAPVVARQRLRVVDPQPTLPYVSATDQRLEGRLYAVNLRTGVWSIRDDTEHTIRLQLPEDLRRDAAVLITRRVRAIGRPTFTDSGRIASFAVSRIEPAPDLAALAEQGEFFNRHGLTVGPPAVVRGEELEHDWFIEGLTAQEADDFAAALADLR